MIKLVLFLLLVVVLTRVNSQCSIQLNTGSSLDPIVVLAEKPTEFLYPPHGTNTITFAPETPIFLICPGTNVRSGFRFFENYVQVQCLNGTQFYKKGDCIVDFDYVTCEDIPTANSVETSDACTDSTYDRLAHIGFQGPNDFIPQITVCFNNQELRTTYANYTITKSIAYQAQNMEPPPQWVQNTTNHIFPFEELYLSQRAIVNSAVNLSMTRQDNIGKKYTKRYLVKGHLGPSSDFFYRFQQIATYNFLNHAPQWETLRGGNWRVAEMNVRAAIDKLWARDVRVYVGTCGVATLPIYPYGEYEVPLYLDGWSKNYAVPEFFYKVLYELGVVLVSYNNPYKDVVPVCTPLSTSLLGWLQWEPDSKRKGYSYVCDLADFITSAKKKCRLPKDLVKGSVLPTLA